MTSHIHIVLDLHSLIQIEQRLTPDQWMWKVEDKEKSLNQSDISSIISGPSDRVIDRFWKLILNIIQRQLKNGRDHIDTIVDTQEIRLVQSVEE